MGVSLRRYRTLRALIFCQRFVTWGLRPRLYPDRVLRTPFAITNLDLFLFEEAGIYHNRSLTDCGRRHCVSIQLRGQGNEAIAPGSRRTPQH